MENLEIKNFRTSDISKEGSFQINFDLINKEDVPKPFQIYFYIDNSFIDFRIGILNAQEVKKISFDVKSQYYNINSRQMIITTKDIKEGVLLTIPFNFTQKEKNKTAQSLEKQKKYTEEIQQNYQSTTNFSEKEFQTYERIVKRIKTGIIGLDDKIQGGLVENSINLVTGKTGTGKTAFCATFLYQGAKEGVPGVYITTEERKEDLIQDIVAMFGWDFSVLEEKKLIKIISLKPVFPSRDVENLGRLVRSYIANLLNDLEEAITSTKSKRVVIDSVSIIEMFIKDEYLARVALAAMLNNLREMRVTTIITGTVPETSEGLSGGGIIEYLVDGIIKLEFMPIAEEYKRTITIRKMRRTNHSVKIMPFEIKSTGLEVVNV